MSSRPSWDDFFCELASLWSTRATCSRRKVGAVLVKDKRVIGEGFNGAPSGAVHCIDGGCPRGRFTHDEIPKDYDYNATPCVALHAECNAVLRAGVDACDGAVLYVTEPPCQQCSNLIQQVKIARVVIVQ